MVATPRLEVVTKKEVHLPGGQVEGYLTVHSSSPVRADSIQARIIGKASLEFEDEQHRRHSNQQKIIDETREIWKYHSLEEMLGIEDEIQPDVPSSHTFSPHARFNFRFRLPESAPTSLIISGAPVSIKYAVEIRVLASSSVYLFHEHPVVVVRPLCVSRPVSQGRINHNRLSPLTGGRGIFLECSLGKTVFTSADYIDAHITVSNRWKESLKYLRFFLTSRIECSALPSNGTTKEATKSFIVDHHGVGMSSDKHKILSGETYTFRPTYNIPCLNPDAVLPGFMKLSHSLCLDVGRSKACVLARLQIPISIVTSFVEIATEKTPSINQDEVLIDLSSSTPKSGVFSVTNPFLDLLA